MEPWYRIMWYSTVQYDKISMASLNGGGSFEREF